MRLQSSHLFPIFEIVLSLGHVEDHSMGMKLGRSIAIDGPCGVVLESGGDEFSGRLRGAGFGATSGICCCENRGSLNRILPIFILHLWIKLGRGRPHSVVSTSRRLLEDPLCNTLRTASSKNNMVATQSNGVKSEKVL